MAGTKEIKRRIKSIGNTKKITKAMEMVAAAKMRRAIEAVLKTRTYANLSWATVLNISQIPNSRHADSHPFLVRREEIKKIAVVLITSNRGLCSNFNLAVINKVHQAIQKYCYKDGIKIIEPEFILIGRKGSAVHRYYGYKIIADFPKTDIISEISEISPVSRMVMEGYLTGEYDRIMVAYTDFIGVNKQVPRVKQLIPFDITTQDEYLGVVGQSSFVGINKEFIEKKQEKYLKQGSFAEFTFEPSPEEVLNEMLPRLVEVQLFQALLEANASEHSARMSAMHQATEAAGDMVNELTLYFNKARQAGITAEIAEISAGANALNN